MCMVAAAAVAAAATHKRGVEVFRSMLGGSDYARRTLDHMIEVQTYLDSVIEAERRAREKEEQLALRSGK